jgi:hypothetical protein
MRYVHKTHVFTVPLMMEIFPLPSTLSVRLAQDSIYHEYNWMMMVPDPLSVIIGSILSIRVTFAVVEPVFQATSTKVNMNEELPVNV